MRHRRRKRFPDARPFDFARPDRSRLASFRRRLCRLDAPARRTARYATTRRFCPRAIHRPPGPRRAITAPIGRAILPLGRDEAKGRYETLMPRRRLCPSLDRPTGRARGECRSRPARKGRTNHRRFQTRVGPGRAFRGQRLSVPCRVYRPGRSILPRTGGIGADDCWPAFAPGLQRLAASADRLALSSSTIMAVSNVVASVSAQVLASRRQASASGRRTSMSFTAKVWSF